MHVVAAKELRVGRLHTSDNRVNTLSCCVSRVNVLLSGKGAVLSDSSLFWLSVSAFLEAVFIVFAAVPQCRFIKENIHPWLFSKI